MTNPDLFGSTFIEGLVAAVKEVPGVDDAAVVARKEVRAKTAASAPRRPASERDDDSASHHASPGASRPLADLDGGPLLIPEGAPLTLQAALRAAAELAPDKGTVFITQGNPDVLQTFPELLAQAQQVLAGLRAAGLRPGDAALFVFDDNRLYITAYWACVLGGFIPTPVAVAATYESPNEANRKLHNAWGLLDHPVLLSDAPTAGRLAAIRALWNEPDVRILSVEELLRYPPDTDWFPATPGSPVLNMLTSGSTGVPKCVHHTNASVAVRAYAFARFYGLTSDDVTLTWMPFDHVTVPMYNVRDVFFRCLHVNAKTNHFLSDCTLWLDWVDRYRVTNTWLPNFAVAMVNESAVGIGGHAWDLSCLREITNGGEPVVARTSHRFLEILAPYGLPADVMAPAWGMSETCSGVSYGRQSRDDLTMGTVAVDPASLSQTVRYLDPADRDAVVISTVGRPIPGVRLRVVDESGQVLPEDRMGELLVRGRTMMHGYFNNPQAQRESFDEDGWFRTGDLAFVHEGEVVIAGRIKDQIIVRGINYLAHELESVVERVDGVRLTFSAAAGVREAGDGTDRLVIFFVPERWESAALATIAADVRAVLAREAGITPDLLIPVTEAEFPKTGSGKVQRSALVSELQAGKLAHRAIGRDPAEEVPDAWLARRPWAELPWARPTADEDRITLVLAAAGDLQDLGIGHRAVIAVPGEELSEEQPGRFRVAPADRAQLRQLLATVTERHGPLSAVALALPLSARGEPADRLLAVTAQLAALMAALDDEEPGERQLLVLTASAVRARPGDRIDLGLCALHGLVRTAADEAGTHTIRMLDLPADRGEWARAVRCELADPGAAVIVAAREGRRWQPRLAPVDEDEPTSAPAAPVTEGGLYLVTGGLGGIGHEIAGYLAAEHGARLLLAGRSPAAGDRADRLAQLAAIGDVDYRQLDVADAGTLEAAVSAAEERWGRPLDGVLHLAGEDPTAQWADLSQHLIVTESMASFAGQCRAKINGALAIAKVLEARPRASLVLFGSVIGEFGGHSFGAYAAANSFLAGFADYWRYERGRAVQCVAWSMWTDVGMNRAQPTAAAQHRGFRPITPAVGLRLFLAASALPYHYLLAGLDLTNPAIVNEVAADQIEVSELLVAYAVGDGEPDAVGAAVAARVRDCPVPVRLVEMARIPRDTDGGIDAGRIVLDATSGKLKRAFEAPVTDLERRLAQVWSDALGYPEIGRKDSFFDLGGNSLRAVRLLALVDRELGIRVTTQELYENPTVAGMAATAARPQAAAPE
jgi:acyl-CoA synthetase (AMP-forming)/AMP-acid ligase II/NAD(P)-dependent dehydrogenase (short-subunit alcohol dehydrogenase family)